MTRVFHRSVKQTLPVAVRGEGCYLYDSNGKAYIDAVSSVVVASLGHGHPAVVEAVKKQVDNLEFAHTSFFTTEALENLASKLNDLAPDSLGYTCVVSGGSEAIEAALKLSRQYFVEIGESQRKYYISRDQSYHGYTLGALSIGGHEPRRRVFQPILLNTHHIDTCYPYRGKESQESVEEYSLRVANELEKKLLELGPENVIAFFAETIVGATAGVLVPTLGYFERIREICDEHGVLLILDEIMCGSGRTGEFFTFTQENVVPDMVTLSKGLGSGHQPVGAVICSDKIYETARRGSGILHGGHTFMGHATASAAACAVLDTIENENLLDNVRVQGDNFRNMLNNRFGEHPNVGDIRGRGLFWGLEFVVDKETKAPIDKNSNFHNVLKGVAQNNGLLIYPGNGTIDGTEGHHIVLAPPFIVDEAILSDIVDILEASINESVKEIY